MPNTATLIIPAYNEESRLDVARFLDLSRAPALSLLFVDDGSTDDTAGVLRSLRESADAKGGRIEVMRSAKNGGKGEAVRQGMMRALEHGAKIVGYADADLSTPPEELLRLRDEIAAEGVQVVTAARVALIGRDIKRRATRHYLGRIFATVASTILGAPFYDTQCGAKYFRASPLLEEALRVPFRSRWAFDVELIGRLLAGTPRQAPLTRADFLEVPLFRWEDVGGSKLKASGMLRAATDLGGIAMDLAARRNARQLRPLG
jgi:glycosyltransferase involved in cell wall biosynthesis